MTIAQIEVESRALCDADSVSYPASLLLIRENQAYEEVVSKIIGCDGLWQFDDTNYTDFPIGTTTLVAGQSDYSFDITHLDIEKVAVLHTDGKYYFIQPIDISQFSEPLETLYPDAGTPEYYDKQGNSLVLYPAPATGSVTMLAGLKVYFQRTASVFTSAEQTAGTKVPGFASPFHVLIAYKAALPYAQSYKKDRVPMIINEINRLENLLVAHYSRREKDRRKVITTEGISFH